ncbi:MAG: DUF4118 domain-containing protein [Oscillospiraceae bacterium]
MAKSVREKARKFFDFKPRDALLTLLLLVGASAICTALQIIDSGNNYISMIFILAVFLVARYTNGYICGAAASLLGVLAVNFFFTYPHFSFNFTLPGYPLTISCMLAVSLITSTLTTRIKQSDEIRLVAEREKMRGNLLRAVSHDLRTPLTSILGASGAILENEDALSKAERTELLKQIKDDSLWLIRMVENLLSITRIDSGGRMAKISKRPEAAEELLAEAVTNFKKRFSTSRVNASVPDEFFMIPMDAVLIEQVVTNLLENVALHATGATLIRLSVTREGDNAVFEVRDDGCGIAPEALPHIFDGYLSSKNEDTVDSKKSMGIGLSVCYTIVRAHGGVMTAHNSEEGGAVFRFTLPLEKERYEQ